MLLYIRSGAWLPSMLSTRFVAKHSASLVFRVAPSALRTWPASVEVRERHGQLVQAATRMVRFRGLDDLVDCTRESGEEEREPLLWWMPQQPKAPRLLACLGAERGMPGAGVLQVGAGVAVHGDHPVSLRHARAPTLPREP